MNNKVKLVFYYWINKKLKDSLINLEIRLLSRGIGVVIHRIKKQSNSAGNVGNRQDLYELLFWFHIMYNGGRRSGNIYHSITDNISITQSMIDNHQETIQRLVHLLQLLELPQEQFQKQHLLKAYGYVTQHEKLY